MKLVGYTKKLEYIYPPMHEEPIKVIDYTGLGVLVEVTSYSQEFSIVDSRQVIAFTTLTNRKLEKYNVLEIMFEDKVDGPRKKQNYKEKLEYNGIC